MKTTFRIFCVLFMCTVLSGALFANDKAPGKELVGKWSCVFDHPMEGPIKGTCTIAEKDNNVTATFNFGDGENTTTPFRANDNGKYYADMDSQGYTITISFKADGKKVQCEMDAGVMVIPMEMEKM